MLIGRINSENILKELLHHLWASIFLVYYAASICMSYQQIKAKNCSFDGSVGSWVASRRRYGAAAARAVGHVYALLWFDRNSWNFATFLAAISEGEFWRISIQD